MGPNIECKDDDGKTSIFSFDGEKKKKGSCSWIKKQVDINEFCEIQSVKSFCKQTCNSCTASLLSLLPSSQPSVDSSLLPSSSTILPPTFAEPICADKSGFIPTFLFKYNNGKKEKLIKNKDCSWVKEEKKKNKLCKFEELNSHCKQTCDMCTGLPLLQPTVRPSPFPTSHPSVVLTLYSSMNPTDESSYLPSTKPSHSSSSLPTMLPSLQPTSTLSFEPTMLLTDIPSSVPSDHHSSIPSSHPPSTKPSQSSSSLPTMLPSLQPSLELSPAPTMLLTDIPSSVPSDNHKLIPTLHPSTIPSLYSSLE